MDEKSGVYRLECSDCKGVYTGETGRQLKLRLSEHKKAWEKKKMGVSAFADHLISAGHSYREGSEVLLHKEDSYFKRIVLEHIEIVRHKNGDADVLNTFTPKLIRTSSSIVALFVRLLISWQDPSPRENSLLNSAFLGGSRNNESQ